MLLYLFSKTDADWVNSSKQDLKDNDSLYKVWLFGICFATGFFGLTLGEHRYSKFRKLLNQAGLRPSSYQFGILYAHYCYWFW